VEDLNPWPATGEDDTGVFFTAHDVDSPVTDPDRMEVWITHALESEGRDLNRLDFVFCSDAFLLEINRTYLDHDTYTDIITFPLNANPVLAEIYISVDRVRENANGLGIPFEDELHRVIIHGVLHLCGYDDHEEDDIREIRGKEEEYLKGLGD
jgi:rRNA maturation RNase YbeY